MLIRNSSMTCGMTLLTKSCDGVLIVQKKLFADRMSSDRNLLYFVLIVGFKAIHAAKSETLSVIWDSNTYSLSVAPGLHEDWVANVVYENSVNQTGWAYLEVYTNGKYDDSEQAYAAGLAEGTITRDLMSMAWRNTFSGYCKQPLSDYCKRLEKYLQKNADWMAQQIKENKDSDPYWHQVGLFLDQYSGLVDGYKGIKGGTPKYTVDVTSLLISQISGDLEDLETVLHKEDRKHVLGSGSCSALIKVLPGNKDLYTAQDTWTDLNSMLRILKKYNLAFSTSGSGSKKIPGLAMTFSSYPGVLYSGDDFYTISSGLASMETTIGNGNADLWKYVTPENAVLEGIRCMVANRLATSGKEWCDIFSRYNSGTYNNEWMIVDYSKFKPGNAQLSDGLLYVLDQIPGTIVAKDLTSVLEKQSYFASYNSPYFPEIFNASGGPASVAKYGDWFTHDHNPRANIFRRDHVKVKDVDSMTKLMRYNDYTHDPLSACNCTPPYSGENSIQARSDLNPANGTYPFSALGHRNHAGIDMKLTTSSLVKNLQFVAISSPPYDNVPAFQWSKSTFRDIAKHEGHPDRWVFKPITHQWGPTP